VVVLAAGRGRRLHSGTPKVLHPLCGRPALWHVLRAARAVRPDRLVLVVHHGKDEVEAAVRSWGVRPESVFVDQGTPHGTGHAVLAAEEAVGDAGDVLVLSGDEPLHSGEGLRELLRRHRRTGAAATLATTELRDASGYGRIVRDGTELTRIAEEREATAAERRIREVATMAYAFTREPLFDALPLVGDDNRLHEHYLPDVLDILRQKGEAIGVLPLDLGGVLGINTRVELAEVTAVMRERINRRHLLAGVTMLDPERTYVDVEVRIGVDTVLHPLTFLEGATRIGSNCVIGPSTRIRDAAVADGAEVTFSVVRESRIGRGVTVGPYASVRPGTVLMEQAKVGSFVEVKAARVGRGSKVPHLSYVGDARIGRDTNIGAATVTVNYDGFDKHHTVIGDEVHIGSDTMLVAPVRVGRRAWTGAGSVITKDVPAGALAVERGEQRNVRGYDDRVRRRVGTKAAKPAEGAKAAKEAGAGRRKDGQKGRDGTGSTRSTRGGRGSE
jgi:bifunctional UDP-N-acetylglucosamine pyrophosphorylase/glucosamine-1-phosphate N-acetyltransferase